MNIKLTYAILHNPIFLGGTNLGDKLDTAKRTNLKLTYNRTEKELHLFFNGLVSIIPASNVASMIPENAADLDIKIPAIEIPKVVPAPKKPIKAQVSTPTDHVFAAEGPVVGAKPKFQGQ